MYDLLSHLNVAYTPSCIAHTGKAESIKKIQTFLGLENNTIDTLEQDDKKRTITHIIKTEQGEEKLSFVKSLDSEIIGAYMDSPKKSISISINNYDCRINKIYIETQDGLYIKKGMPIDKEDQLIWCLCYYNKKSFDIVKNYYAEGTDLKENFVSLAINRGQIPDNICEFNIYGNDAIDFFLQIIKSKPEEIHKYLDEFIDNRNKIKLKSRIR